MYTVILFSHIINAENMCESSYSLGNENFVLF